MIKKTIILLALTTLTTSITYKTKLSQDTANTSQSEEDTSSTTYAINLGSVTLSNADLDLDSSKKVALNNIETASVPILGLA